MNFICATICWLVRCGYCSLKNVRNNKTNEKGLTQNLRDRKHFLTGRCRSFSLVAAVFSRSL